MQNFSRGERVAVALYLVWFFIQIGLFFYSADGADSSFFWPFTPGGKGFSVTYDITEFAVYILSPLVLFIAYKIISGANHEEVTSNRRHSFNFFIAFLDEKIKSEELIQKINELQNKTCSFEYLNELKADREKAANQNVNNWLNRVEVRKKYKQFEN
jgi:hypothetical protein